MQHIQLNIPEPCHQDWQQMTPAEQGRFCNACAKQVVDFSTMTDTQVLNYFANIKNEKVCGRAYPDQLDRMITLPKEPKKRLFWRWNYITMLFLFFSKTNNAKAQGGIKVDTVSKFNAENLQPASLQGIVGGISISVNRVITGTVKDESGMPIGYATVRIKKGEGGVSADTKGEYRIRANINNEILQVSAVGFVTKEIVLSGLKTYDVILERSMMGEVVIVGGMISSDGDYTTPVDPKHITVLEVKDNATMQPVKATVIIERKGYYDIDSATTDKKGSYKIKKIREYETYTVKIKADGYIDQELEIKGTDFDQRKITKQIFLEKTPGLSDYKKMPAVTINSSAMVGKLKVCTTASSTVMGDMLSVVTITNKRTVVDSFRLMISKINGAIKISPNPVQKGNVFNLSLKLKQTGVYNIQIINAAGLIVLQKQSTATAKQYIEQVQTGKAWSSGIYYVSIFDANNKLISTNNFLIQ
jgi:hypothetical protein